MMFALGVEFMRLKSISFSGYFNRFVGNLLRSTEQSDLTGATYLFIGAFITILFFSKEIAVVALIFLMISDALAALVGKLWGKRVFYKDKTIEGSSIFLLTAFSTVVILPTHPLIIGFIGACTAFIIDVFVMKINDNLMIPVGSGFIMQIFTYILS